MLLGFGANHGLLLIVQYWHHHIETRQIQYFFKFQINFLYKNISKMIVNLLNLLPKIFEKYIFIMAGLGGISNYHDFVRLIVWQIILKFRRRSDSLVAKILSSPAKVRQTKIKHHRLKQIDQLVSKWMLKQPCLINRFFIYWSSKISWSGGIGLPN